MRIYGGYQHIGYSHQMTKYPIFEKTKIRKNDFLGKFVIKRE